MIRNRFIFPIALLIAILLHWMVFVFTQRYYIGYRWELHREIDRLKAAHVEAPLLISLDPPPELDLGKQDGVGDAVSELDSPEEMTAPEADQIQAPLSRDPAWPSDPEIQPDDLPPIPAPTPPADQPPSPPPPPLSREITQDDAPEAALPAQPGESADPAPLLPLAALLAEAAREANPDAPAPDTTQTPPRAAPVDPLPQADLDSDPFHTQGSITFTAGKVETQFGRAIKPVRPKIRLAGQWDGLALQYPSVTLRIRTDENGQVRAAEVIDSSGSLNIDHPVLVAIYDWWFEPPKDAQGNPRPDVFTFTLNFR